LLSLVNLIAGAAIIGVFTMVCIVLILVVCSLGSGDKKVDDQTKEE
jgi:hypothetical protein